MRFCVLDIETTGLNPSIDRITEIAAVRVRDGAKEDELHLLLDPQMEIPHHVKVLTGLNTPMLEGQKRFEEVVDELADFLEDHTIVAHQAHFDVNFLKEEFKRAERVFQYKSICTLRLSRRILPMLRGYTLAHVCQYMGIVNPLPHRAWGDAHATMQVFQGLLGLGAYPIIEEELKKRDERAYIPQGVSTDVWQNIPNASGVYYFSNKDGKVIYVGKAKNLAKRIPQHFKGSGYRAMQLRRLVHDVQFTLTGSEIIASLLEDSEIRRLWPEWNRAQKFRSVWYGVVSYTDMKGDLNLRAVRLQRPDQGIVRFSSPWEARNWLFRMAEEYQLDYTLCGLPDDEKYRAIDHAKGVQQLIDDINQRNGSFLCVVQGRTVDESGVIVFRNGDYIGFGFAPATNQQIASEDDLSDFHAQAENNTIRPLMNAFLQGKIDRFTMVDLKEGTSFATST